jgi:hypothetical protein
VLAPSYFCLLSPSLYTVATGVVPVHGPFCFISCSSLAMRLTAWLRAVWSLAPTNHHVTQCSENATTATPKPPHALATGQPHTHDTTYTLYMNVHRSADVRYYDTVSNQLRAKLVASLVRVCVCHVWGASRGLLGLGKSKPRPLQTCSFEPRIPPVCNSGPVCRL